MCIDVNPQFAGLTMKAIKNCFNNYHLQLNKQLIMFSRYFEDWDQGVPNWLINVKKLLESEYVLQC